MSTLDDLVAHVRADVEVQAGAVTAGRHRGRRRRATMTVHLSPRTHADRDERLDACVDRARTAAAA